MDSSGAASRLPEWEENTERRLGIVEQKIDKLLDPEHGIYPKVNQVQVSLMRWGIVILTTLLINAGLMIAAIAIHGAG